MILFRSETPLDRGYALRASSDRISSIDRARGCPYDVIRKSKNSGGRKATSKGLRPLRSRLRYFLQSKCTSSQQFHSYVTKTASQGFSLLISSTLLQTKQRPMPAATARSNHW